MKDEFLCLLRNLEISGKCGTWFLDRTFKVCPKIFVQIFTIIGTVSRGQGREEMVEGDLTENVQTLPVPLAYALSSSKTQSHYTKVLRAVHDAADKFRIQDFSPFKIMTDFELTIINAAKEFFSEARLSCCFLPPDPVLVQKNPKRRPTRIL